MNRISLFAAAAVVTSLAAGPVLAKDTPAPQTGKQVTQTQKIKKNLRPQARIQKQDRVTDRSYERGFDRGYDRGLEQGAQFDRNLNRSSTTTYYGNTYDNGFWPADVAADVVADTVTAADAIATAPFRDTYAYDNSYGAPAPAYRTSNWDSGWNDNWARRQSVQQGGFACTPGTSYTNSYGYSQLCQ